MSNLTTPRSWLDPVLVISDATDTEFPRRRGLKIIGGSVVDNELADRTEVTIDGSGPSIATVDATPVYATLATLVVGQVRQIDIIAKVAKADGTVRQVFKLSALYYGAAGPTATIDGSVSSVATGTGTAMVTLDVSGAAVRLKVTGIAATSLLTTYEGNVL